MEENDTDQLDGKKVECESAQYGDKIIYQNNRSKDN